VVIGMLFCCTFLSANSRLSANHVGKLTLRENETIIVFAPHPDDEIIGCAGIIQECLAKHGKVYIVFLTNGDHNQFAFKAYTKKIALTPTDYIKLGEIRRQESTRSSNIMGIPSENLIFLGYPDCGTLKMWENYWNTQKPFKNFFTRKNFVPYLDTPLYGEAYLPENIENNIQHILEEIKPSRIFVSHPADQNSDHRALFNFVYLALLDCKNIEYPQIYCYLVHAKGWPKPKGVFTNITMKPPEPMCQRDDWVSFALTRTQKDNKACALDCFKSQLLGKKNWMFSFVRTNEIFQQISFTMLQNKEIPEITQEESLKRSKVYNLKLGTDPDGIIFNLAFDKKLLEPEFGVKVYLYPWRKDIPFSLMPKILLQVKLDGKITIYDNEKKIALTDILVDKSNKNYIFKFPMEILANPDAVFIGGETKISTLTLDFFPWQVVRPN